MTQVFVTLERDTLAGRCDVLDVFLMFPDAVNQIQSRVVAQLDDMGWQWTDNDWNIHPIVVPNFNTAVSTVLRGTTRTGIDDLIIIAGNRSWEFRIAGLLDTYEILMKEAK